MATATKKQTTSGGGEGALKHLTRTSPATARAIRRHQTRQADGGRPVARLVKR